MLIFGVEWKWNIPNALSVLRIVLVPVFMTLYLLHLDMWAFGVLLLSGVTDCLDGVIARRLHQITDCGKLLDPVSDKLTQVGVVICLTTRYPSLLALAVLCLVKESCQAVGGLILLKKRSTVRGSKWFGKLSTVVFYGCMLAIVLWSDSMPEPLWWGLIGLAGLCMLVAFIGYLRMFIQIYLTERAAVRQTAAPIPAEEPEKG